MASSPVEVGAIPESRRVGGIAFDTILLKSFRGSISKARRVEVSHRHGARHEQNGEDFSTEAAVDQRFAVLARGATHPGTPAGGRPCTRVIRVQACLQREEELK